jgi:hypothetical protein
MNGNELIKMMSLLQNGEDKYYCTNGLKQIMSKDENNQYYLSHLKYFNGFKEEEIIPDKEYTISAIEELIVKGKSDFRDVLSWYQPRNLKCDYGDIADIVDHVRFHFIDRCREIRNLFKLADASERFALGVFFRQENRRYMTFYILRQNHKHRRAYNRLDEHRQNKAVVARGQEHNGVTDDKA